MRRYRPRLSPAAPPSPCESLARQSLLRWAHPSDAILVVKATQKFKAHDGKVLFVTFAPAGGGLLSTGDDGAVRLWLPDGSEAACLRQPKGWFKPAAVVYAAFTADIHRVFSVSADGVVRLWNLNTSSEVRNFALQLGVTSAALSPDGRRLLVGGGRSVTLWDVELGRLILRFGGGPAISRTTFSASRLPRTAAAFSPAPLTARYTSTTARQAKNSSVWKVMAAWYTPSPYIPMGATP